MVPIPGSWEGSQVFQGARFSDLEQPHRPACTNPSMPFDSNMPDLQPVLKRARISKIPDIESEIEQQTNSENQPGGVISSQANLFNNLQPSANLSSNDIMHNSTGPACDVPVNDFINRELDSQTSLMSSSETVLPQKQAVNTHNPSLRSSAGHTESGGGEIRHELDPSLSKYEVLCEQLFDRIRKALIVDEATNSPEKTG